MPDPLKIARAIVRCTEEWVDAWLAWKPPAYDNVDTGRIWRTHQSRVMLNAFKDALNGNMTTPPEET